VNLSSDNTDQLTLESGLWMNESLVRTEGGLATLSLDSFIRQSHSL
jgi:hypothetical protein